MENGSEVYKQSGGQDRQVGGDGANVQTHLWRSSLDTGGVIKCLQN